MRTALLRLVSGLLVLSLPVAGPVRAMVATVPTQFPDIQSAVAALKVSPDVTNFILIAAPSISTSSPILVDFSFNSNRQLTLQPLTTLARAQILSDGANSPILSLAGCGYVQVQDLDIVRTVTNTADLFRGQDYKGNLLTNLQANTVLHFKLEFYQAPRSGVLPDYYKLETSATRR